MRAHPSSLALALALTFAAISTIAVSRLAGAEQQGEDVNIHNKTGHDVDVFLFQDDKVHLDESGGTQIAHLKQGESAAAHVPNCKFGILLVNHDDVWHREFQDCKHTDVTFTKDTGHAKKKR